MSEEKKDLEVIMLPEVQAAVDADPELAKAIKEFSACARQAMAGVQSGQYKSFDDAMEAITGSRPERLDLDD